MNVITLLAQASSDSTRLAEEQAASMAASMGVFWVFTLALFIIFFSIGYVITGILFGRIFKKAGLAQWPAWVPFYNTWKFFEIGGQHGMISLLSLVPFVNIVGTIFFYIAAYHIGLKLQKDGMFVLLAIFLPIVWIIWLAVDDSVWDESRSSAPNRAQGPLPKSV